MKKHLLLFLLMLIPAFGTTWAQSSLNGCRHITDLSQIKEGAYYYIVSDRTKYVGNSTGKPKAMSTLQSTYSVNWGSQYVYWGDLDRTSDGYQWTAEKVGDKWAFKNKENGKYLGEKNTSPVENDVVFSDTPINYTLTADGDGSGRFSFVHAGTGLLLNVQGYGISRFDNSLMLASDNLPADVETNGYPSRWHLYELTGVIALKDGGTYYIINDLLPSQFTGSTEGIDGYTGKMKAMSTQQNSTIHPRHWSDREWIYWGDFVPNVDNDGYKWEAQYNESTDTWSFKNLQNNKYLGALAGSEVYFSTDPVNLTLSDLAPGTNRVLMTIEGQTKSMHVQAYSYHCNSCLNITSDIMTGDHYPTRWHIVAINDLDDFFATLLKDNSSYFGTNEVVEVYADVNTTNVIGKDGKCANLVITDGEKLKAGRNFTATTATYTRDITNAWGTICLPYEVSSNSDVTYYTAGSINGDVLTLTSAETVPAGTPAIFKVNGGTFTATSNNVEVLTGAQNESITDDDIVLHGTLGKLVFDDVTTDTENDYYYISNNKFMHATRKLTVNPFRAYFTMAKGSASSNGFSIAVDDDSMTAIEALTGEGDTTITAIYTTDGKQLSDLQQGLNIVKLSNGKVQKIMVK